MSEHPSPAFAATATWTAVATRDARARRTVHRTSTLVPARTIVVLQPGHKRRVRVAQNQNKPVRKQAQPSRPVTNPRKKKVGDPAQPAAVDLDVNIEEHVQNDTDTDIHDYLKDKHQELVELQKTGEQLAQSEQQTEKARAQKAFLDEKLAQRQATNLQKMHKHKRQRQSKRVRPSNSNLSSIRNCNATSLKDTFQAYMDEISREQLLDQCEVIQLATQIKLGVAVEDTQRSMEVKLGRRPSIPELAKKLAIDAREVQRRRMAGTAAKNALVAANLRLVTSVARKVSSTKSAGTAGIALDDMVQEGSVGLIRAAEKFDASRGYKFSTYATWWVRAYVMRSITTQSRSIKVPSTIVDEYARIRKQYSVMRENGNFKPSEEQVAYELGITAAKLRFVVKVVTQVPTSLDLSLNPTGDTANSRSLGEIVEGDDNVEERVVEDLQRKELDTALRRYLRPLERAVVRLRFGLDDGQPRTLRETGDLLGLSKERIRQLLFRALPKMKTPEIQQMLIDATTR